MELIPTFIFIFIIFFLPTIIIYPIVKHVDNHKQNLYIKRLFKNKTHITIDPTHYEDFTFDLKLEFPPSPMGRVKIKIIYLKDFQAFKVLANAILNETGSSSIYMADKTRYMIDEYCLVNYKNKSYVIHTDYKTFKKIKKYCYQLKESKKQKQIDKNFTKQIEASIELFKEIRNDNKKISEKEIRLASNMMDTIKLQIENNELFPKLNYKEEKKEESIFPSIKHGLEESIEYENILFKFDLEDEVKFTTPVYFHGKDISDVLIFKIVIKKYDFYNNEEYYKVKLIKGFSSEITYPAIKRIEEGTYSQSHLKLAYY